MKVALLTSAIRGANAGDAIIEDSARRLIVADTYERIPLLHALGDEELDRLNQCDAAVICGTNLYQEKFNCNLGVEALRRIRVPVIPLGIGTSARIGHVPTMNREGAEAVRLLHERCGVSSARDRATVRFLHSIGVRNVVLTACPVLFHGLRTPLFDGSGEGATVSPRARLLHTQGKFDGRQMESLHWLCRRYRPLLILQSPWDLPMAEELARQYGLETRYDPEWQAPLYVERVRQQAWTAGFRLHFGMLSLSYGKPAHFVAHDSRVSEFCELMDLPYFDIADFPNTLLGLQIDARSFPAERFGLRWNQMAREMKQFLSGHGLTTRLEVDPARLAAPRKPRARKPRILMLMDKRQWSFDHSARQIADLLSTDFQFDFKYVTEKPALRPELYDLTYLFFWGEQYYRNWPFRPGSIIKEVSSHRWEDDPRYGPLDAAGLARKYLEDAGAVICTSERLFHRMTPHHPHVYWTPNGFEAGKFGFQERRHQGLVAGWAGSPTDKVKGFSEFVQPACEGLCELRVAAGNLGHGEMREFYNSIDVFIVGSRHEGEPLTLVESMACGCFPVGPDIGIFPELVDSGENGIIVKDRTREAFRDAVMWCAGNLEKVRAAGRRNAELLLRERRWNVTAPFFKRVFVETLDRIPAREGAINGHRPGQQAVRDLDLMPRVTGRAASGWLGSARQFIRSLAGR